MRATGLDQDRIDDLFRENFENSWFVWNNNLIPVAITKNINAINQQGVAIEYMKDVVKTFADKDLEDESSYNWSYRMSDGRIVLYDNNCRTLMTMTVDEFTDKCNEDRWQKYLILQEKEKAKDEILASYNTTGAWLLENFNQGGD